MKQMICSKCGNRVLFENLTCETCRSLLGFAPEGLLMLAFDAPGAGSWGRLGADMP